MTAQHSAAPAPQPTAPRSTGGARIRVGSAPDSWGVWFPDDPQQVPWQRFLDEVSAAGYEWIELGPYGYLPTDPARLSDELAARGLRVSAGTVFEHLHRPDSWDDVWRQVGDGATLTAAMGVVAGGGRLRAVLVDVYAALGLDLDPATAGAVQDLAPHVTVEAAGAAIAGRWAPLEEHEPSAATRALAAVLAAEHRVVA